MYVSMYVILTLSAAKDCQTKSVMVAASASTEPAHGQFALKAICACMASVVAGTLTL